MQRLYDAAVEHSTKPQGGLDAEGTFASVPFAAATWALLLPLPSHGQVTRELQPLHGAGWKQPTKAHLIMDRRDGADPLQLSTIYPIGVNRAGKFEFRTGGTAAEPYFKPKEPIAWSLIEEPVVVGAPPTTLGRPSGVDIT